MANFDPAPHSVADIGVTGMAVMGSNLARNLARNGFKVAIHNRSVEKTERVIAEHGQDGEFVPAETMDEFVASLQRPRVAIIMVKAGKPVDEMIEQRERQTVSAIFAKHGEAHFRAAERAEGQPRWLALTPR